MSLGGSSSNAQCDAQAHLAVWLRLHGSLALAMPLGRSWLHNMVCLGLLLLFVDVMQLRLMHLQATQSKGHQAGPLSCFGAPNHHTQEIRAGVDYTRAVISSPCQRTEQLPGLLPTCCAQLGTAGQRCNSTASTPWSSGEGKKALVRGGGLPARGSSSRGRPASTHLSVDGTPRVAKAPQIRMTTEEKAPDAPVAAQSVASSGAPNRLAKDCAKTPSDLMRPTAQGEHVRGSNYEPLRTQGTDSWPQSPIWILAMLRDG